MKAWIQKIIHLLPFRRKTVSPTTLTPLMDPSDKQTPWWGTFLIDEEQSRFFKIGNLVLCLDRYNREWRITSYREGEQPFKNFATQASNEIILKPTLPDRAMLSALDRPFYIPSGETLLLYASSPVWIRIEAGNPPIVLDEIATETLADTWFGKNTQKGELCYTGNIHCSSHLDDLLMDTTRVITPIYVENHSKETLLLETLRIPLPFLAIYSDHQNHLWTEAIHITQENVNEGETEILKGPPLSLQDTEHLSVPRTVQKPGLKTFFSPFMWRS